MTTVDEQVAVYAATQRRAQNRAAKKRARANGYQDPPPLTPAEVAAIHRAAEKARRAADNPPPRKPQYTPTNDPTTRLDARISRCGMCGAWRFDRHCNLCLTHPNVRSNAA